MYVIFAIQDGRVTLLVEQTGIKEGEEGNLDRFFNIL